MSLNPTPGRALMGGPLEVHSCALGTHNYWGTADVFAPLDQALNCLIRLQTQVAAIL